jgi:signal transduction histidine kinase
MTHSIDPRFLALIVHDLRNPLNVIGLSVRMIEEVVPKDSAELDEDFGILRENLRQMERMLAGLSDYCRLTEGSLHHAAATFDPRRLLSELVEEERYHAGVRAESIDFEAATDCPREVELDPYRARQALQHALANAVGAAASSPIHVSARGGPARWITEIAVLAPPGEAVRSGTLQPDEFQRLSGNAAERLGLELAIVAAISAEFGGTARLEVEPSQSRLVIDWPARAGR